VFVIRQAKVEDIPALLKLAKTVHFINLPADRDVIYTKVMRSHACFLKAAGQAPAEEEADGDVPRSNGTPSGLHSVMSKTDFFMYVLEDTETSTCLGTSQVIAKMGGPGNPNYSLKLHKKDFFSQSLQTGTSHIVRRRSAASSCNSPPAATNSAACSVSCGSTSSRGTANFSPNASLRR
jgi:arginine/ornithine N-succinyltransferase beta subunit